MTREQYPCFGVSFKIWLSRRKFFWLPRMGPKYAILDNRESKSPRKITLRRPYSAWIFVWMFLDVVVYLPQEMDS